MRPWLTRSLKAFLSADCDTGQWQPVISNDTNPLNATRGYLTTFVGSCSTTRRVITNQLGPIMKASLMLASTCFCSSLDWSWRDEWLLCNTQAGSWSGGARCWAEAAAVLSVRCLCSGICVLGTDEPHCHASAPSVALTPRCGMRKHPQGCSTDSLPNCSFSHPLAAAVAQIYAQYLLSCLLWLEKGGGGGAPT